MPTLVTRKEERAFMPMDVYLPISEIDEWRLWSESTVDVGDLSGCSVDVPVIWDIFRHNRPRSLAQFGCGSARQAIEFIDIARDLGWELDVTCVDPKLRTVTGPISYPSGASGTKSVDFFWDFVTHANLAEKQARIVPIGSDIVTSGNIMWMSIKLRDDGYKYDIVFIDISQINWDYGELIASTYSLLNDGGLLIIGLNDVDDVSRQQATSALAAFTSEHFLGLSAVHGFALIWRDKNFPLPIDSSFLMSWQGPFPLPPPEPSDAVPEVCLAAITKNESAIVAGMIRSAAPFITSAVFVDNESGDATVAEIRAACSELNIPCEVRVSSKGRFDDLRNESLSLVPPTAAWILVLDADERLSPGDLESFRKLIHTDIDLWALPRLHLIQSGQKIGIIDRTYADHSARLFRAHRGLYWVNPVHEAVVGYRTHGLAPCYNTPDAPGGPHIFHLKGLIRTEADHISHLQHYTDLEKIAQPLGYAEANRMFERGCLGLPVTIGTEIQTHDHQHLRKDLAEPFLKAEQIPGALEEARQTAIRSNVHYFSLLGETAVRARDFEAAKAAYLTASSLAPEDPAFLRQVAHCLSEQKKFGEAIQFMERSVYLMPGHAENNAILAHLFASNGQVVEAEAFMRRAVMLAPDELKYQQILDKLTFEKIQ